MRDTRATRSATLCATQNATTGNRHTACTVISLTCRHRSNSGLPIPVSRNSLVTGTVSIYGAGHLVTATLEQPKFHNNNIIFVHFFIAKIHVLMILRDPQERLLIKSVDFILFY